MSQITDPSILAQLNSQSNTPQSQPSAVITNPAILAQLNPKAPANQSENYLLNLLKSAAAGAGQLGQNVISRMETQGPLGLTMPDNPINAMSPAEVNALQKSMRPIVNAHLNKLLNIPDTTANRITEGLVKNSPQIAAALATGGVSSLPEFAGGAIAQGGFGAAAHPNHPISGAITDASLQAGADLAPALLSKAAKPIVKESMDRLVPFAKGIYSKAQEGYDVLKSMGKTKLLDAAAPSSSSFLSKINNPDEVANYLKSVKGSNPANADIMAEMQSEMAPNYADPVTNSFDQDDLDAFAARKPGNIHKQFNIFKNNPTAENAGIFHRALGAARTGDVDSDATLNNMRDSLRDNIIIPGIRKFGSDTDVEKYANADLNYRLYKKIFGNDKDLENIAKGNVSPKDLTGEEYYNILKNAKNSGNFNEVADGMDNIPMHEYNFIQRALMSPTKLEKFGTKHAKLLSKIASVSPIAKILGMGTQNDNQ